MPANHPKILIMGSSASKSLSLKKKKQRQTWDDDDSMSSGDDDFSEEWRVRFLKDLCRRMLLLLNSTDRD